MVVVLVLKFRRFMPSAETLAERRGLFYPQFLFRIISTFLVSVFLIILSGPIKAIIFKGQVVFSMYFVALILIAYLLYSVSADYFRYTHRMNYFTIAITSEPYLTILFIALAIYIFHKKTLNCLLLAYLFALILIVAPLLIKLYREIKLKLPVLNLSNIIEDVRLGFPLVLSYLINFILSGSDRYVIAAFISTTAVGHYNPAYTLGSLIILFPRVFGVVLPSLLSKAADSGRDNEVKVLLNYAVKLFLLIGIPFIAGSYILSRPLLELFANREVADAAYLATPVIAAGILFFGLNLILGNILFLRLKTKVMLGINVLSAGLNLALNIILVYLFRNILIAAITTLISYLVSFILLNVKVKKYFEVDYNLRVVSKCALSSVLMGIVVRYTQPIFGVNANSLMLSIFTGIITYIILLFAFRTFNAKELNFVRGYTSVVLGHVRRLVL